MGSRVKALSLCVLILWGARYVPAQGGYAVVSLSHPGKITGTVRWSGPVPRQLNLPINKDASICDPAGHNTRDLERLVIGPQGGVANTVVYLKNISSGKPFSSSETRQMLDQRQCRYEPHILLVPEQGDLHMKSSDPVLHTVHMDGAASYNLPFPFPNREVSRSMPQAGVASLKCNGGHVWMNAEMIVAKNPYYAVTGQDGKFELDDVPPGAYQIVAWHEGWSLVRQESAFDVLTERRVQRPVFSQPRTWEKEAKVLEDANTEVDFTLGEK